MVSFATLILTLVTGIYPVEVMVDGTVASVEMRLDGEVVGQLNGEPWRLDVDFGGALQPHELVAIARDARGRELSRARQMINLPRPPASVVLVRDRFAEARLGVVGHELWGRWALFGRKRARDGLRPDDSVYLLDPVPKLSERAGPERWLFPLSPDLADYRRHRGVTRVLTKTRFTDRNPGLMRSAQAVATAGLRAAGLGRPRAVVLVLGSTTADTSLYTPRNARSYLETLQVPLFVWFADSGKVSPLAKAWEEVRDVSNAPGLLAAVEELRATLDRQRIVWLRGRHLPQQIELSAMARRYITFAGRSQHVGLLDGRK